MDIGLPDAAVPNSAGTYDFVHDRLANGTALRLLCVLYEHSRECMTIEVGRRNRSQDVILTLSRLMKLCGKPQYLRSDNGAEFTAGAVMRWLPDQNFGPAFIAPGRPWQNFYLESIHGKLHDECLNREGFHDVREIRVIIERWRSVYNHQRPDSAPGYQTPAQTRQAAPGASNIEARLTLGVTTRANRWSGAESR